MIERKNLELQLEIETASFMKNTDMKMNLKNSCNMKNKNKTNNKGMKAKASPSSSAMKSATAITMCLLASTMSITRTDAFSPLHLPNTHSNINTNRQSNTLIHQNNKISSTNGIFVAPGSYSHTHTALSLKERRRESPLGVRRRVRSVLKRAKSRTGIRNRSEYMNDISNERGRNGSIKNESTFNLDTIEIIEPVPVPEVSLPVEVPVQAQSQPDSKLHLNGETVGENAESQSEMKEHEIVTEDENLTINGSNETAPVTKSTVPSESKHNTIKVDSSINTLVEAASIGGLGSVDLDYNGSTKDKKLTLTKSKPASTYSGVVKPDPSPGDDLIPSNTKRSKSLSVIDALSGDASAAFSMPPPPLPFTLPDITAEQRKMLVNGERIQYQSDMGREGSGYVVLDVNAPSAVVWDCLLDFYAYPNTIPTVRDVQMFTNTHLKQDLYSEEAVDREKYEDGTLATLKHGVPSVTRASFSLSKFRLKIAAIHKYRPHPAGDYMIFTLDPSCTNVVLKNAKGVWHTESNPDGRGEDYTRVWLLCELSVSNLLPQWITDYAAKRAMPRATTWIKPHVEAAAELWLKE